MSKCNELINDRLQNDMDTLYFKLMPKRSENCFSVLSYKFFFKWLRVFKPQS